MQARNPFRLLSTNKPLNQIIHPQPEIQVKTQIRSAPYGKQWIWCLKEETDSSLLRRKGS